MDRDNKSMYGNHHLNDKVFEDCKKLLQRCMAFAQKGHLIPTDEMNMKHFGWSKDRINRCYQMLKMAKIVDYSRNNRRSTLKFLGDYAYLNKFMMTKKKR